MATVVVSVVAAAAAAHAEIVRADTVVARMVIRKVRARDRSGRASTVRVVDVVRVIVVVSDVAGAPHQSLRMALVMVAGIDGS